MSNFDINVAIKDAIASGALADEYFIPSRIKATCNIYLSERNRAKTTTWLIVGIAAYVRYGTITHVIRSRATMIAESKVWNMYNTLIKFDYITKLTCGKWNHITYNRAKRTWTLCKVDKTTLQILEKDETPCTVMMSVDKSDEYKSGYVCDCADLVIYDEFQNISRRADDSILFINLLSTLFRSRRGCKVIMLSNTIDKDDKYFDELFLRDFISLSEQGDKELITTPQGTKVYCEYLDKRPVNKLDQEIINEYYQLNIKGIESVTGEGWQVYDAKHIDPNKQYTRLTKNVYVYTRGKYIHVNIVQVIDTHKVAIYITPATHDRMHKDEIVYTRDISRAYVPQRIVRDLTTAQDPLSRLIRSCIASDDIYASDNTTAYRFKKYIDDKE